MMLRITEITYGTPDYDRWIALRHAVLRAPLGLEFTPEQLAADKEDRLLAAMLGGEMVGSLIIKHVSDEEAKLRQMAVAAQHQGLRIGSALLAHAEGFIIGRNYAKISLHARQDAVPFYEKHHYIVIGEPFIEVTLPHLKMEKSLR